MSRVWSVSAALRAMGDGIDAGLSVVAPRAALRRVAARSAMYAAARSPRAAGDWSPVDSRINEIIGNSSATVRARIRQLVRDFPCFARANKILADYTVGDGIVYQASIRDAAGALDQVRIAQAEDAWNRWADEADVSGRHHLYELMHLAKRQEIETGEFFLILRDMPRRGRLLPLALQLCEGDWLTSAGAQATGRNGLEQGVEFDRATGAPVAYHFADPDDWGKTVRVTADRVIHGFRPLRPGQLRGISDFAPGVLLARDLSSYMDTEIDAAKMAAKWVGFVTTPDILGRQAGLATAADGRKLDTVESAIIEYLRPGESITLNANPRPGSNFPPMVRLILTMLAVTTDVPYELLSGDYQGMNYSVGKMVRVDFAHALRPMVGRHVRRFCRPVQRAFMDAAVLAGVLRFPGYFADPVPWQRAFWAPPGMESIDISREAKAQVDQIAAGLRSPQEIASARGRDLEEVYREIKEARDLAETMGLAFDLSAVSTALADNPAALEGQNITTEDDA